MELAKNYTPQEVEPKWYEHWVNRGYFSSKPDQRDAYTIVIPPPNVTGVLHMGHALNNSVQDVLIRYARLKGYNTCWVPGTDHASIATEAKVVAMLREQGIDKNSLSREEFLKYAWEWKEKYGGIILQQLKKLGCSLDWDRTAFTMDPDYYKAVIDVFLDLHKKGHIFRGVKMINWDPKAKTALSDEEVIHKEVNSKLVYIRYFLEEQGQPGANSIVVATVRPETILGDAAVCVHPDDERYKHLVGTYCYVPLLNRRIPIIADDYIDIEFGTGCLKVTPAHDINDYNLGLKHKLPIIDTLNEDGTLSEAAVLYVGQDRFDVRKQIVVDLQAAGHIEKIEDYTNQVGFSERTDVVIEPRLSMQWWCRMETMAKPALDVVMNDEIRFYPAKFKNTYRHWMENIKDWCISRQLRWGHRIPAWYDGEGNVVVAANETEAHLAYQKEHGKEAHLTQDSDVLDTWFSSWLWPMEVFGWNKNPDNDELKYYYPTATLVTAPEIIFFWVARMIMAGLEYRKEIPFKQVYFTGIVRDKQGRKMSKSLGNSPDLLQLIDQYGADAVRFGVLISSPAGNDLLFDEGGLDQGRLFGNKLWNALKLLHIFNQKEKSADVSDQASFPGLWFEARLNEVKGLVEADIKEFKLSEALKKIYSLIWDDFCSWYLEWIKTAPDQAIPSKTIEQAMKHFEELLKLLHPFMPFLTEELYAHLQVRNAGDDLASGAMSNSETPDEAILKQGDLLKLMITAIRDMKVKQNLKPKDAITLFLPEAYAVQLRAIEDVLARQSFATEIQYTSEPIQGGITFVVDKLHCYFTTEKEIDQTQQTEQLKKDLAYLQGFLLSLEKKLGNEKFMANAKPEVVENELKKKNDALEKIRIIEESLTLL
ncbi:MAG: valine--tRNA ligase [Chitinophagaceae bacterium]|nr:valine--tRNA ligase [Chitinophagaceae bacterium]